MCRNKTHKTHNPQNSITKATPAANTTATTVTNTPTATSSSPTSASSVQIFNNPEFGDVRVVMQDGEAWFVGKDVAKILGYANPNEALHYHVDNEDKLNSKTLSSFELNLGQRGGWLINEDVAKILGYANPNEALHYHVDNEDKLNSKTLSSFELNLGQRGGWLINESGLYSLILSSKLPSAKKFKRWVTSEVLPTIRKTGGYVDQSSGWLINESGLYSLILSSKLPSAKKFKRWVTSEVLPTIRKTGGYVDQSRSEIELRLFSNKKGTIFYCPLIFIFYTVLLFSPTCPVSIYVHNSDKYP